MTIGQALRECGVERADAFALLGHCLQRNKAWLIAHAEDEIPAAQNEHFLQLISRKMAGEPVAYLTGKKEFYGREFVCTPATLVPRPETELLVELALYHGDGLGVAVNALDLGTGTGCIAITLAAERANWRVRATDVSANALDIAQHNARVLGVGSPTISFSQGSWFDGLNGAQFDVIVSNPPYIANDDPHLQGDGLRFEPRGALTDDHDGLEAYRVIAVESAMHVRAGGVVLVEHGFNQASAVAALFERAGTWNTIMLHRDLAGLPRVTTAVRM